MRIHRALRSSVTVAAAALLVSSITPLSGGAAQASCPVLGGFGGNAGYGTGIVPKSDDGSSSSIDVSSVFPNGIGYFGSTFGSIYINVNGNITFEYPLSTYTPYPFPVTGTPMIAPWFADVDTRSEYGSLNNIYYHFDTAGKRFVITWYQVDYFAQQHAPGTNTFQLILTNRDNVAVGDFDVEFRFQTINWTTGDASGGSGGFGGTPAQVGFNAGNGVDYASHPYSRTSS
ncbi:MAG: nidogen, partial [Deltaproteobacteria bacterium HGW-Deltaproteobacteria-14]